MQSCRQASNGNGLALSLSPTGTRWSSANSNHAQDRDAVLSERAGLSFPNTMGARIGRASTPSDRCAPRTKGVCRLSGITGRTACGGRGRAAARRAQDGGREGSHSGIIPEQTGRLHECH